MDEVATATVHEMPVEIIKAVIAVMKSVKKLGKEGNNTFARYHYTSVDQFYEALGPLMAEHGLVDVVEEISTDVEVREGVDDRGNIKKSAWLRAEYEFRLFHESGAVYGPLHRAIQVQAVGAQSFASAQSYVEKYFLRNLFKVPTGDADEVDRSAQEGLPEGNVVDIKAGKKITATQASMVRVALDALTDKTVEQAMLDKLGVSQIADIPSSKVEGVMKTLSAKMEAQAKAPVQAIQPTAQTEPAE